MRDNKVEHIGRVREESEDVRASSRKVRGFDLANPPRALDERSKKAHQAVVADTTKVLETATGKK